MTIQFWKDYASLARARYDVPVFFNQTQVYSAGVWPSFFDNSLQRNKRELRRQRVQIVHVDDSAHVSLFVKNAAPDLFANAIGDLIEPDMTFGQGRAWPSIQIDVPSIETTLSVADQEGALRQVFEGASRLFRFYVQYEVQLLAVPRYKAGS